MKIEEEIRQKNFRNEYQKVAINLIYSANWLLHRHKEFFARFDITQQQYNVLRILRGQYPDAISTSEIKLRMLDKNSDASRIVERLAIKSLVNKRVCKTDKRLVDVTITPAGLDLLKEIDDFITDLDNIVANLSPEEAGILNNLLDKIRN